MRLTSPCCDLSSQLHSLLVTAVVSSRPATIFRWDRNVAAFSAWASGASVRVDCFLIAFDNNASAWRDLRRPAGGLRIVDASLEKRFHPKQYLQAIHLRRNGLAAQYRFLWFLDEDIEVGTEGFDLGDFFRRFACGFMEGTPIIAQAQISPDTQAFHVLNHATFLREARKLFGADAPTVRVRRVPDTIGRCQVLAILHGQNRCDSGSFGRHPGNRLGNRCLVVWGRCLLRAHANVGTERRAAAPLRFDPAPASP